ncbi:MAG: thioesterase family protein [Planctomycetota bacterium]
MKAGHGTQSNHTPAGAPDTSGRLAVRVRYVECDPMGVAHHASYLPWLEMGRTELLRTSGVTYGQMEADGFFLVITRCELKYRRPIRYDDVIEVRTRVEGGSRIKIRHTYELALIERNGMAPDATDPAVPVDGVCAVATTELACVGGSGRPQQLPDWLVAPDAGDS